MKLRNKKTGQEGNFIINKDHFECVDLDYVPEYRNLAELNEEWEDYDETKEYYLVDVCGEVEATDRGPDDELAEQMQSIGNYFETKEEAEKAVEKLKAWKRLKDKGFRFILDEETEMPMFIYSGANGEKCITNAGESKQCRSDIKLLFGGEK